MTRPLLPMEALAKVLGSMCRTHNFGDHLPRGEPNELPAGDYLARRSGTIAIRPAGKGVETAQPWLYGRQLSLQFAYAGMEFVVPGLCFHNGA